MKMTSESPHIPLLIATGQKAKLHKAGLAFLGGALSLFMLQYLPTTFPFFALLVAGLALGTIAVSGALYACFAIRCTACRLAWVRWAISKQTHDRWLHWLYSFDKCPQCGYSKSLHSD